MSKCEECSRTFPSGGKLMQHKLRLRYFCCHCSRNFPSVAELKLHHDSLDISLHVCPFCRLFRNVSFLQTFLIFSILCTFFVLFPLFLYFFVLFPHFVRQMISANFIPIYEKPQKIVDNSRAYDLVVNFSCKFQNLLDSPIYCTLTVTVTVKL